MKYRSILLIDDDDDDQEIFLSALTKVSDSIICTPVSTAYNALQQLVDKQIIPDIIFLDLNMPIMNGQQFLVEIKKKSGLKDIPVVIFSTSSHPNTIRLAMEFGAMAFITKPNRFDDVVSILTSILL